MRIRLQLRKWLLVGFGVLLLTTVFAQKPQLLSDSALTALVNQRADSILNGPWFREVTGYQKLDSTAIKKVDVLRKPARIRVYADAQLAYAPFREAIVDSLERSLASVLGEAYTGYGFELYAGKKNRIRRV